MLLELVWQREMVQCKTSKYINSTGTSVHEWFIYGSQFVTLFEYLVLQSPLFKADFRKFNHQKIFSLTFDFTVESLRILKLVYFGEGRNITIEAFLKADLKFSDLAHM